MASLQTGLLSTDFGWNSEMLVFLEGGKPKKPQKYPRSKDENQHQTQPTYETGRREIKRQLENCKKKKNESKAFVRAKNIGFGPCEGRTHDLGVISTTLYRLS